MEMKVIIFVGYTRSYHTLHICMKVGTFYLWISCPASSSSGPPMFPHSLSVRLLCFFSPHCTCSSLRFSWKSSYVPLMFLRMSRFWKSSLVISLHVKWSGKDPLLALAKIWAVMCELGVEGQLPFLNNYLR